jgi:hypothetical protein
MLPSIATKSIEHVTSTVISAVVIMVAGAVVAALLARSFGGKSRTKRQAIFSVVSFGSICAAAYYGMSKLSGGG